MSSLFQIILLMAVLGSVGPNMLFWSLVGILRFMFSRDEQDSIVSQSLISIKDVAVVIAAHNEEMVLPGCIDELRKIINVRQIHVADDASSDATKAIAKSFGCKIFTSKVNIGKAKMIEAALAKFRICKKYAVVLILDADSEIDPNYFTNALTQFSDLNVAVVAGHVVSRPVAGTLNIARVVHKYRVRLYLMIQTLFRYGQSWKPANVTFVAPGFASTYRASVLEKIEISSSGLVIEDINMTFQVHKAALGKVVYSPYVKCSTEDPASLSDYSRQVRRWNLGLWQTIKRQGIWPSKFWLALGLLQIETIASALFVLLLPGLLAWGYFFDGNILLWSPLTGDFEKAPVWILPILFVGADFLLSVIAAILLRSFEMILYAPFFLVFRVLDAWWTLATIPIAIFSNSSGVWKSPMRASRSKVA